MKDETSKEAEVIEIKLNEEVLSPEEGIEEEISLVEKWDEGPIKDRTT